MQPLLSTRPLFSTMGNHEEESEFRYGELQSAGCVLSQRLTA